MVESYFYYLENVVEKTGQEHHSQLLILLLPMLRKNFFALTFAIKNKLALAEEFT